jgi:hypothetical protein
MAAKAGSISSPVVAATFINSASLVYSPGFVKQEFYSGATRANLENPAYTNSPTSINYLTSFETPAGQGSSYAERVSGFFIPPQTTDYVFFLAADDDSDLFLSIDSNPANKRLIAQETAWSNSRQWVSSGGGSVLSSKRSDQFVGTAWPSGNTISLNEGTRYYIEGVHHQGSGGDAFGVTYIFAGASDPVNGDAPQLVSDVLAVNAYNNTFITITNVPQNAAVNSGARATFNVGATSGYLGDLSGTRFPPIAYQWQLAPFGAAFADIPSANTNSYTTPPLSALNDGSRYRAALSTAGFSTTSPAASVTVGQLKFTTVALNNGQVVLQWTGNAVLEESTNLLGPWTPSSNQSNPQTVPIAGLRFYRLRH